MELMRHAFSSCVILLLPIVVHTEQREALVFNRFREAPIYIPREVSKTAESGAWAVACPAETAAEYDFVERYSFTKNALFVRKIHNKGGKAWEVKKNVCEESPKISITFKMKSYSFQFGYEVYYELNDARFFHLDTYKDYKKPEKVTEAMKSIIKRGIFEIKEYFQILSNTLGMNIKELWFNEERRLGFVWLYLFKINFDLSKKILKMAWYIIDDNNRWTTGERCDEYNLGSETYEGIDIDKSYVGTVDLSTYIYLISRSSLIFNEKFKDNQSKVFQNLNLPQDYCESTSTCLTKWLLIPLDQFRFVFTSTPVCSNMATIPIWQKKVLNVLKKLDAYLYSLFRVVREPIHVISGVFGEVKVSTSKFWRKPIIYLDPERKKIPVPKIIYKIVEYRLQDCKLKESLCWYSVVIVIHNDPYFDPTKDQICDDVTSMLGWEEIKTDYESKSSDIIYVCLNARNVQKQLSIRAKEDVAGAVDLYNFKGRPEDQMNTKYLVDQKFKHFRENGEIPDFGSDEIIERVHTKSNIEDSEVNDHLLSEEGRENNVGGIGTHQEEKRAPNQ